jgi:arylsulfatase A-like enzyme
MFKRQQQYDDYILYVDREFGRLFNRLEEAGLLSDTWVVLTSDHGELFERGIVGHATPVLYEPVIRVPLMVFEPGRTERMDIQSKTSAVDVLPTLLHIIGKEIPAWTEGTVLPPFSETDNLQNRGIYVVQSKDTDPDAPLKRATIALIRENYKLLYFTGYPELGGTERIELYNIFDDPHELNNIYTTQSTIGKTMVDELKFKLTEKNRAYLS